MDKDKTWAKIGIAIIVFLVVLFGTAGGIKIYNEWQYSLQKADDATNYKTLKKVEDTCRAMISSYETDKLTYEQYSESDDKEKRSWAEQAKMRANKTASTYNNYILENSFVWAENVPKDIRDKLEYIE